MRLGRPSTFALLLVAMIGRAGATLGQSIPEPTSAESASQPAEPHSPSGPALPEAISLPGSFARADALKHQGAAHNLRFFGWANGGYTWSSTGTGLLNVEPRMNRFGDAWLMNQAALVLERTLGEDTRTWSWGGRAEFYMGADAALLHPVNGFGPSDNPRFSTDFRQAYISLHAPVLTSGGVDFKFGRQYVPLGYESAMAPYRPMYSLAYAGLYSANGATTGATATIHVNPKLDIIGGVTLVANSLFELRGRAPCYIARALYWPDSGKGTKVGGTFYTGPQPIAAARGHAGKWQTEMEFQVIHNVNRRLTLVSETNAGQETGDPANKLRISTWFGTYGMGIVHLHRLLDCNSRAEWFDDSDGSRIGTRANYAEITMGFNFMPARSVNFRPEVRWDVASRPVFGPAMSPHLRSHQWTFAFDMLVKF